MQAKMRPQEPLVDAVPDESILQAKMGCEVGRLRWADAEDEDVDADILADAQATCGEQQLQQQQQQQQQQVVVAAIVPNVEAIGVGLADHVREACLARAEAAVEQAASAHAAMLAAAAELHGGSLAAKRAARVAVACRRAVAAADLAVKELKSLP